MKLLGKDHCLRFMGFEMKIGPQKSSSIHFAGKVDSKATTLHFAMIAVLLDRKPRQFLQ